MEEKKKTSDVGLPACIRKNHIPIIFCNLSDVAVWTGEGGCSDPPSHFQGLADTLHLYVLVVGTDGWHRRSGTRESKGKRIPTDFSKGKEGKKCELAGFFLCWWSCAGRASDS